jgi:hypothetical protein
VTIDFHPTGSGFGSATFELVASVAPNGQVFTTMLEDAQGQFTLTPAPGGGSSQLSGVVTLSANPVSAALVSSPLVVEHETLAMIGTFDGTVVETGTVDFAVTEATVSVPSGAESEQIAIRVTVETETLQVSAVHAAAAISGINVAPLAGLVFQFANTPVVNVQGSVAGQHLADQIFQTLGRVTSASDATLTSAVKGAFDHLAAQLMLSTSDSDLDSLNWDDLGGGLDLQAAGDSTTQVVQRVRPSSTPVTPTTPPAAVQHAVADQAAVDQIFSETSQDDDVDYMVDE